MDEGLNRCFSCITKHAMCRTDRKAGVVHAGEIHHHKIAGIIGI